MRKGIAVVSLIVTSLACATRSAEGQRHGVGGVIDWISKLSGPGFVQVGGSFAMGVKPKTFARDGDGDGDGGLLFRLTAMGGPSTKLEDNGQPVDEKIGIVTAQLTLEYRLPSASAVSIAGSAGYAFHRFFGGPFEPFNHSSFPVQLSLGSGRSTSKVLQRFRLAVTLNIFPPFPDDAFAPLVTGIDTQNWEFPLGLSLIIDIFDF